MRANNATGSSWTAAISVTGAGYADYASLAVVDGRPAIAYYDNTDNDLCFTIPRQD